MLGFGMAYPLYMIIVMNDSPATACAPASLAIAAVNIRMNAFSAVFVVKTNKKKMLHMDSVLYSISCSDEVKGK